MASRTLRNAVVLATTGLLLATAAGTASATTRVATSLSIRAVPHASSATVSGVLLHGRTAVQGAVVTLTAEPAGTRRFTAVQSLRTNPHGGAAFVVTPTATTRYALLFAGNSSYRASHSGVVTVRAPRKAVASSLSIRTAASSINKGQSDVVSGVLRVGSTPLAGRHVTLLGRPAGSSTWTRQATHLTGPYGGVAFTVSPTVSRQFALAFAGDSVGKSVRSGVVTVIVRKAATLSITAASATSGGTTISGVLQSGSDVLAGRNVALQSRPGAGGAWTTVTTAATDAHGAVAFHVTPSARTAYQLVFAMTARYLASTSSTVVVDAA